MGLNAVQTYAVWNWHETAPGAYDFASEGRDLVQWLKLAQAHNLLVLFRAGPYICGEHDFGGFPARLLNIPGIELRTNNSAYLAEVTRWWDALLPVIAPYTYANGGPIAMVQIENEFGSYGHSGSNPGDKAYLEYLASRVRAAMPDVQLYTTDGGDVGYLTGGTLPGVAFATGDWGPDMSAASHFAAADQFNPPGWRAHTDSEYYTGWLTHWGEGMANTSAMGVVGGLSNIRANNGSFNLYMAFGGTNWGYWNGANGGGTSFQPVITSYDYDSPIQEGGGHGYGPDGDKFAAVSRIVAYWTPDSAPAPPAEPPAPAVAAYGPVALSTSAALFDQAVLPILAPQTFSGFAAPPTMEALNASHGYMLYTASLPSPLPPAGPNGEYSITFSTVADRAEVFIATAPTGATASGVAQLVSQGTVYRPSGAPYKLTLSNGAATPGAKIVVLLENMGHINYGHGFFDPKSVSAPTINGHDMEGTWSASPLGLHYNTTVSQVPFKPGAPSTPGPALYQGTLTVAGAPADTYVTLCGWHKGQVWVNGFHVGRYWQASEVSGAFMGPQAAYFVPAALLRVGANNVTVFEQHAAPANATVGFVDAPDFTGAVCGLHRDTQATPLMSVAHGRPVPRSLLATQPARAPNSPTSAAAAAAGTCSAAPGAGTDISLQPCDAASTPAAITQWQAIPAGRPAAGASVFALASQPTLCVTVQGTNPDSGSPNLALGPCDVSNRSQHYLYFPENGNALLNPIVGGCVDIEGGGSSAGSRAELYSCTGGKNQAFEFTPVAGGAAAGGAANLVQLVGIGSGLCLAAC